MGTESGVNFSASPTREGKVAAICHCMTALCNNRRNNNINNVSAGREPIIRTNKTINRSLVPVVISKYCKECKEDLCAICLGEFKEGEGVRVLSECTHIFHVSCIDKWIENQPNCPLCRANTILPSISNVGSSSDSGRVPEIVAGNSV
ncbi:hypothetical protein CDL12_15430 [Handroanthus impetiginosus]|uniref:RING-type domain-containing protein n=1 Tax=Handroanthus impetiginosus TaxID=429701 RepID=A0A2G9H376_9LAMI|nr:hypothetical protein CDL12_15430 [Handroanthus impetiginosus]